MSHPTTPAPEALPLPTKARWTLLRGGLQNVWEYDDRRFVFERGRLLLRGQNEAGKTKAMELLFPFLLDADLAPHRLDPFGSTARPMRWNLLNEADPELPMRTGYVWLELGRLEEGGTPEYATIGCGLRARRSTTDVDHWFFVTSRRVDEALRLVEDRQPLSRAALADALCGDGQVFDRGADHRRAVNARLLGMPDEQYAALVETLLQLRRPQLSKSLDLDQLSRLLSASLPPLDRAVVGPIAEGFERLDHHRADLEGRVALLEKIRGFEEVHRAHARAAAKGRAVELTRAESAYHAARAEARERAAQLQAAIDLRDGLEQRVAALDERARALVERIRALEGSDAYRAVKDLAEAEQAARSAAERAAEAGRRASEDGSLDADARARLGEAERDERRQSQVFDGARAAARERAREAVLEGGHDAVDGLAARGDADAAASALAAVRGERAAVLDRLEALAGALTRAAEQARRAAERAREKAEALELARDALRGAERALVAEEDAWEAEVERWIGSLELLPRDALPPLRRDGAIAPPGFFREAVHAAAEPVRGALAAARASAEVRRDTAGRDAAALRAEREALAATIDPLPPAPTWRPARPADRPGAPLFLLCEFGRGAAGAEAGLEGALEASGLLDAWVEPDGTVLDAGTDDAILRPAPVGGPTLADVLAPVARAGVGEAAVRAVLASIALVPEGEAAAPGATAWLSPDGRWGLGPIHGAHRKDAPAWVGATARERERARRIEELDARIATADALAREADAEASGLAERAGRLGREVAAVPPGHVIEAARARVEARAEALAEARERSSEAERAAAEAERGERQAAATLDETASAAGLAAFARDPGVLAERTRAWVGAAEQLVVATRERARCRKVVEREGRAAADAEARAARSRELAAGAAREAAGAEERARTLREASGKEAEEVLAALRSARDDSRETNAERAAADRELAAARESVGVARGASGTAEAAVGEREQTRQDAARALRALEAAGVLASAGLDGPAAGAMPGEGAAGEGTAPSFTSTLELARHVDGAVAAGASPEERDKAEDRLMKRASDLQLQLPPEVRLVASRAEGVLAYRFTWGGAERAARELVAELDADVASRRALLGDEERELLEQFLSGEAHDHLAARLREARALVDRMNAALEHRTTAAGSQVRLVWALDDAALDDAREAVPLFLKSGALLSERNRGELRAFLERRLAIAREADGTRTLQDRLLDVLDYRSWHRFHVDHRTPGEPWAKLTRKAHAAGSGGKKAVMLHLPLFAAAAAFYDSARPTAPRVIALDEAFAGIDRPTRGKLMGLLADFDLDFVMTSFEEWGCYEELDGISTYHLSRAPGQRGVYAERFLWNGRERVLVEES